MISNCIYTTIGTKQSSKTTTTKTLGYCTIITIYLLLLLHFHHDDAIVVNGYIINERSMLSFLSTTGTRSLTSYPCKNQNLLCKPLFATTRRHASNLSCYCFQDATCAHTGSSSVNVLGNHQLHMRSLNSAGRKFNRKQSSQSQLQLLLQRSTTQLHQQSSVTDADTSTTTTTTTTKPSRFHKKSIEELIDIGTSLFQSYYTFPLDDWQVQAGGAIASGYHIVVCSPTGSGKTIVGEMALRFAYNNNKNGIYTTPLKALSNQKYTELQSLFNTEEPNLVGISTGDVSINKGTARITVMTTEVYRNIAWRATSNFNEEKDSTGIANDEGNTAMTNDDNIDNNINDDDEYNGNELSDNAVVVLDEFHYMGQPGRGGVWEESVITSPSHTQIIALSATMSNAYELSEWIETVTNRPTILIQVSENKRPVPLRYLYATKDGFYSLFRDPDAGPGSPKGLLGYRRYGDTTDINEADSEQQQYDNYDDNELDDEGYKRKKRGSKVGFGNSKNNNNDDEPMKLPRGLQVNPELKKAADMRLQRVTREIQRLQQRNTQPQPQQKRNGGREYYDDFDVSVRKALTDYNPRNNLPPLKLSPKQAQKEKERLLKKEMRRLVPSLHSVAVRLHRKELVPAIFFIFSRAGCDEAAKSVTRFLKGPVRNPFRDDDNINDFDNNNDSSNSGIGNGLFQDKKGRTFRPSSSDTMIQKGSKAKQSSTMYKDPTDNDYNNRNSKNDFDYSKSNLSMENLKYYSTTGLLDSIEEVSDVASRIAAFNRDNEEIAFSDSVMEQFLFGIGSHHAGMLPAHKSFVEILFRQQLMKVVFATETLAAGINMPARTTVICALAKPGGPSTGTGGPSSMSLLDTHNLLQMAGRAGRRGMDTAGTCVIVATPFENEDVAAKILTDPIKPIQSQFSPSYSLCINLIERGQGRLVIARQLVSRSFDVWQRSRILSQQSTGSTGSTGVSSRGPMDEVSRTLQEAKIIELVSQTLKSIILQRSAMYDIRRVESVMKIMNDRDSIKGASKSYVALERRLEIEKQTLQYLDVETDQTLLSSNENNANTDIEEDSLSMQQMLQDDKDSMMTVLQQQRSRVNDIELEMNRHPFTYVSSIINQVIETSQNEEQSIKLTLALSTVRDAMDSNDKAQPLTPTELSSFSKSFVTADRMARKAAKKQAGTDDEKIQDDGNNLAPILVSEYVDDDSWNDFVSITKVLLAYGCLVSDSNMTKLDMSQFDSDQPLTDSSLFTVTPAGTNVGLLGLENSLWILVALGGASDSMKLSSKYRYDYSDSDNEGSSSNVNERSDNPTMQRQELVEALRTMSPSEIAGYASCIISEDSRSSFGLSVVDQFQQLSFAQQEATQKLMFVMDRLKEVQSLFGVDNRSGNCNIDLSTCKVVTAWADGCSWNDALQISGLPPGDLVRVLSRSLDALRQIGNLPYMPVRGGDGITTSSVQGIHPEIRQMCRKASKAINRYPLKDPFSLQSSDDDDEQEEFVSNDLEIVESRVESTSIQ